MCAEPLSDGWFDDGDGTGPYLEIKITVPKSILYVGHPVSGDVANNCRLLKDALRWLIIADPSRIYIAPWLAEVEAFLGQEITPDFYDRVLEDDCEVVRRLDGVLLVGARVSKGMSLEADAARATGKPVIDLTGVSHLTLETLDQEMKNAGL